jgi:hypothetical protein
MAGEKEEWKIPEITPEN